MSMIAVSVMTAVFDKSSFDVRLISPKNGEFLSLFKILQSSLGILFALDREVTQYLFPVTVR